MKLKKLLSSLLCLTVVLCVSGCDSKETDGGNKGKNDGDTEIFETFDLLYCAKDSMNPYAAATKVNKEISLLLYESLFTLDNNFEPVNILAESYTAEGKTVSVKIKSDSKFSDGSRLSADDVLFSYNLAKNSKTSDYTARLKNVLLCERVSDTEVKFTFNKINPYAVNILDFLILKSGSTNLHDDDNVALPPIGSGLYVFNRDGEKLIKNSYNKREVKLNEIFLTNTPDNESVTHNIEVGNSDIYYNSVAETSAVRMPSSKKTDINTTNLVYLGANLKSGISSNVYVRYAVSAALDREDIVKTCYYSKAVAATGIFHPEWEPARKFQTMQTEPHEEITVVNLEQIGYNKKNGDGYYVNKNGNPVTVSVLVNSDNASRLSAANNIVAKLNSAGIKAKVVAVPYASYVSMLENGNFEFYLAETRFNADMDISSLVYPNGSAAYGVDGKANKNGENENNKNGEENQDNKEKGDEFTSIPVWKMLDRFYSGTASVSDVVSIFESDLPVIPICYRSASLFYDSNIKVTPDGSYTNIYLGAEKYTFNSSKEE